ncbi:MAG: hypothetical protein JXC32_10030, partial [Anaerolineae bacterium]|nr:hypothetical protein [Anaerolineae bacterium]
RLTPREALMMLAFFVLWVGLLLGWRWELLGGALVVGGMLVFYALDYAFSGSLPRGGIFMVLASPGLLYLIVAWWARREG